MLLLGLYEAIVGRREKISVVGLGYVGLPLAVAFARVADVVGYDINRHKVEQYHLGIDATKEVGVWRYKKPRPSKGRKASQDCKFHIVAVPTPLKDDKT